MSDERRVGGRAASERDAARARVRRITGVVLAASVAVAGSLAGYVSSAASGRKTVPRATTTSAAQKTKRTGQVAVPATPPAPSLIPSGSQSGSSQAPAQAPVQSQAPPVAVSGGS
jgi:hypothetical protein